LHEIVVRWSPESTTGPAEFKIGLALLVPQILRGKHLDSPLVTFRHARKLSVESHPGMWFSVDSELVGNEPAHFEVLPRALRVIVGEADFSPPS
jgi:diacylglycerol kinase (ATP)